MKIRNRFNARRMALGTTIAVSFSVLDRELPTPRRVVAAESPLITSAAGEIKGILAVPDPKIEGNPKFRTGEVEFRLTSSATDVRSKDPETEAQTVYNAVGILETEQETIIATRNADVNRTALVRIVLGHELLQTLLVAERSGTLDAEAGEPEACRRELGAKLDLTPS